MQHGMNPKSGRNISMKDERAYYELGHFGHVHKALNKSILSLRLYKSFRMSVI